MVSRLCVNSLAGDKQNTSPKSSWMIPSLHEHSQSCRDIQDKFMLHALHPASSGSEGYIVPALWSPHLTSHDRERKRLPRSEGKKAIPADATRHNNLQPITPTSSLFVSGSSAMRLKKSESLNGHLPAHLTGRVNPHETSSQATRALSALLQRVNTLVDHVAKMPLGLRKFPWGVEIGVRACVLPRMGNGASERAG